MDFFRYIDTNFAKFILSFISDEDGLSKREKDIILPKNILIKP